MTFFEWECPECCHINPREDDDLQRRGWIGTIQCFACKRRFELKGLYEHGFVFENSDESRQS